MRETKERYIEQERERDIEQEREKENKRARKQERKKRERSCERDGLFEPVDNNASFSLTPHMLCFLCAKNT
jgi:hypothetical protein